MRVWMNSTMTMERLLFAACDVQWCRLIASWSTAEHCSDCVMSRPASQSVVEPRCHSITSLPTTRHRSPSASQCVYIAVVSSGAAAKTLQCARSRVNNVLSATRWRLPSITDMSSQNQPADDAEIAFRDAATSRVMVALSDPAVRCSGVGMTSEVADRWRLGPLIFSFIYQFGLRCSAVETSNTS